MSALRTMQFEIQRPCPVEGGEPTETLPFAVFVYWPAGRPLSYEHEMCDGVHYRVTRESALEMGFEFATPWVCEHMGRLIQMTEPTKGPYEIDADGRSILAQIPGRDSIVIARVHSWIWSTEADANARLFAASWDLLATCRALIDADVNGMTAVEAHVAIAMCKAAVAKADGVTK